MAVPSNLCLPTQVLPLRRNPGRHDNFFSQRYVPGLLIQVSSAAHKFFAHSFMSVIGKQKRLIAKSKH